MRGMIGSGVILVAALALVGAAVGRQNTGGRLLARVSSAGIPSHGRDVFLVEGCSSCHTFEPADAHGTVGPDLDTSLAPDAKRAGRPLGAFVAESILEPDAFVPPGFPAGIMPRFNLSRQQLDDLVSFLIGKPFSVAEAPPRPASPMPKYSGKIVFSSDRDGPFEIYVMRADGSGVRRLTTTSKARDVGTSREQGSLAPRWSPDGKQIVFQSGPPELTQGQVYVMNADGTGKHRLTSGSENILPAWSPNGSAIAFVSGRDGYARIYVMDATGRNQRPLTPKGQLGAFPTWSPDGKRIAFACSKHGAPAICAASFPDGRVSTILSGSAKFGVIAPDWSPDDRTIVFAGGSGTSFDIYTVGADGNGLRRLTTDPGEDTRPDWSPDGRQIIFSSNRAGSFALWAMNANGSRQTQLTNTGAVATAHDDSPDWASGNPASTTAATSPSTNPAAVVSIWVKREKLPTSALRGANLFVTSGCLNCHAYAGTGGGFVGAPDLSAEGLKNRGVAWQIAHLRCPACEVPGSPMPSFTALGADNLAALAVFLEASKGSR